MTLDYKEFDRRKHAFFLKHKSDFTIDTSSMNQYGVYHKEYIFADGAVWYERYSPAWRKVEMKGIVEGVELTFTQDVKLFETEAWNTEDPNSIFYYEKF